MHKFFYELKELGKSMAEHAVYSFKVLVKRDIRKYKEMKNLKHYVMKNFSVYRVLSVFYQHFIMKNIRAK